jgi:predicted transcriptional regulator YheO
MWTDKTRSGKWLSDPEKSIVAIANGQLTGRKVGDSLDVLGIQLIRQPPTEDLINYQTTTKSGKILRSSSVFLRDETGEIFGAFCVNYDISGLVKLQEWLRDSVGPGVTNIKEGFENTVDEVLEMMCQDAFRSTGKQVSEFTREDKIAVISYLEIKGAFLIRYSVDHVAELLNISKFTIYNYLDELKATQANSDQSKPMTAIPAISALSTEPK